MATRLLTALLVCVLSAAVSAQAPGEIGYEDVSEMPGGIEGERIQLLFNAFNMSSIELAGSFYDDSFSDELKAQLPREGFLSFFLSLTRQTDAIEFHSIREYDPPREDVTVIIFRDMTYDSWKAFSFHYAEGEKPGGLLTGITVNDARTPSNVEPSGPLSEAQAVTEILGFLDRLCEGDLFSGTVMVARGNQVLVAASCGEASKRFHAPVDLDTKFNIGSMNKMFTSVAIMQLVDEGVLAVDDPIGKYLDESWLSTEILESVTIHHLLSHTSGLGSFFTDDWDAQSRKLYREVDDWKPIIVQDTLAFEPGTEWSYSNTGMYVLGAVIESATGENYFDYIRENVYAPAGMENTDCYDMDCPVENLAIGYWPSDDCAGGWKNNYFEHTIRGGPAGGGFSTSPDLLSFARALQTGKLVSKESLEKLWTISFDRGSPYAYGYGFSIRTGPAGKVVGHGGGFLGINANLDIFLDKGYISVVMTNLDGAGAPVDMKIAELLARVE
jgi:CubicO group peptidase (beta-lactamase class C family)